MSSDSGPKGVPVSEAVRLPGQRPSTPHVGEVGTSAAVPSISRLGPFEEPLAGPDGPVGPEGPDGPIGPGPSRVIAVSSDLQDFPTVGKRIL